MPREPIAATVPLTGPFAARENTADLAVRAVVANAASTAPSPEPIPRRIACRCPRRSRPDRPTTKRRRPCRSNRPLHGPDALGRFGSFGGRFVPETLMDALNQLAAAYEQAKADPEFQARLDDYLKHYVGRPSPLFHAERLTEDAPAGPRSTSSART